MPRVVHVKKAQQRYRTVPVIDPETGEQKVSPVMRKDGVTPKLTKSGRPVVMRLTVADKTQPLPPERCGACGKDIEVGTAYKWVKPKSGGKRSRHATCPSWRPSELTGSAHLSTLYAAQETAQDALDEFSSENTPDDAREILETLAESLREVAEGYRESAQNIEDGFGHETSQSMELAEKADEYDGQADEVEQADLPDEFDEDTATEECKNEATEELYLDEEPAEDADEFSEWSTLWEGKLEERRDEWFSELQDALRDAIDLAQEV